VPAGGQRSDDPGEEGRGGPGQWVAVAFFDDEHAAGAQGRNQPFKDGVALRDMDQHVAGVDEMERAPRQLNFGQVLLDHIDIWSRPHGGKEASVEVYRQHTAGGPDSLGKPTGDRSCAGAEFRADPALANAGLFEKPERRRVGHGLEKTQPLVLAGPLIGPQVGLNPVASPFGLAHRARRGLRRMATIGGHRRGMGRGPVSSNPFLA
jgi:hypothetical protein